MDKNRQENTYLQQVLQEQAETDRQLKRSRARKQQAPAAAPQGFDIKGELPAGRAVDYRITGFWLWKSVVVPPNVYVVHTRCGQREPIHMGRGISFRFNPLTDAFLVIPSAVQTILINANCICIERQGILVQAYVQWIIDDIKIAYWKLDFSDPEESMGIVNLQLREQAEAAIKDKVATMSIDEVLSDKQPIIEELTHRLQTVAEGTCEEDETSAGLGLKIVTVQIKEAVVSSTRLWQNLQVPFRAEREKLARLASLRSEQEISTQELENRLSQERAELNASSELEQLRATQERAKYDREQAEQLRRHNLEQDAERQKLVEQNATAQARNEAKLALVLQELELEQRRLRAEIEKVQQQMQLEEVQRQKTHAEVSGSLEIEEMRDLAKVAQRERELALLQRQRDIDNDLSEHQIQSQLIAKLPEIAQNLPTPQQQRTTIITSEGKEGAMNPLLGFLAGAVSITQDFFQKQEPELMEEDNQKFSVM
jgi:hypothetical protein